MKTETLDWMLRSDEPWTRLRVLEDLLGRPAEDADVQKARADLRADARIQSLAARAAQWEREPLRWHNDAGHPLTAAGVLIDFGFRAGDAELTPFIEASLRHISDEGAFQNLINIARTFGGSGQDEWTWLMCDAPVSLGLLLAAGLGADARVQRAVDHLVGLVDENGWQCKGSASVGKFRGPGRRGDPCPVATLDALQALAYAPQMHTHPAVEAGVEMILGQWSGPREVKYYLFGMGSDFRKVKYPFLWFDIFRTVDVLSRFAQYRSDSRVLRMARVLLDQRDDRDRFQAGSMYQAWKGWSFADKKAPSPWLTYAGYRIHQRLGLD